MLSKTFLILRSAQRARLEGRTTVIQPSSQFLHTPWPVNEPFSSALDDGADLHGAGSPRWDAPCPANRGVQVRDLDQIVSAQLLLGLGKRAVMEGLCLSGVPHCRRHRRRLQLATGIGDPGGPQIFAR